MSQLHVNNSFWSFMRSVKDDIKDVEKGLNFLDSLMRNRGEFTPPMVEIVTVIKHEKPILYQHMKQRIQYQYNLRMIFELDMDYETAKNRLL